MENSNQDLQKYLANLPAVDYLLQHAHAIPFIQQFGLQELTKVVRIILKNTREAIIQAQKEVPCGDDELFQQIDQELTRRAQKKVKAVLNLTGTVLHTNLGRAVLPIEAVEALKVAASEACILEYDTGQGKRGDRDQLVEELLCELTGAQAATVVNNNAAAVFLILHALSAKKETILSRGELVEIGGAFRIPDIMQRAGVKLVEVGTTNRTHPNDFEQAITNKTAMLMKVHASNYAVQGFTSQVEESVLAKIANDHHLTFAIDLGSGSLVDMTRYGLPKEPTPMEAIQNGAHLVTFSGDKLLGGPQCGMIVGNKELINKIKKNPLKRMLRVSKLTLAALEAVLHLYRNPDALPEKLTVLRQLTRTQNDITQQVERILQRLLGTMQAPLVGMTKREVMSQIGSGSLPIERLPSMALAITGLTKEGEKLVLRLEKKLRNTTTPVIGRMKDQALLFDLRCLRTDQEDLLVTSIQEALHEMLVNQR